MTQPYRLRDAGTMADVAIDATRPLSFDFDGAHYQGYAGDTLASALLANGVHLVGRSFKYHRPRGIYSAGAEEPNALVQLGHGARTEPNVRATTLELFEGLAAASQNRWPSLRFDAGAINDMFSRVIPAGFYYKTFMWPPSPQWWLHYEHYIRRAAGMGKVAHAADPDHYEHQYAHCDVLVIGGGLTGLAAARAATQAGARVIVCDESPRWGGGVQPKDAVIDGHACGEWVASVVDELATASDAMLLLRTTAFGYYDGNMVGAIERVADHAAVPGVSMPRQRMWKIRASAVVLASGAVERGVAYADNDLPGTMLAGAARAYVRRYGVRPGNKAVVFTNNDGAYADAIALRDAGVTIAAIVDARAEAQTGGPLPARARAAGLPISAGSVVSAAHGSLHVSAVDVTALIGRTTRRVDCDLVAVSGGWSPAVHLFSQARGKLRYDDVIASFVPDDSPLPIIAAGAANGRFDLAAALCDGHAAGTASAERIGLKPTSSKPPQAAAAEAGPLAPLWAIPARRRSAKRFVDLQNDVTVNDVALAAREGYRSVEHLKRYTTLGMGTDQGKTSNLIGLALMAEQLGVSIPQVGTTTFRPPYTPVALGAIPGHASGPHIEPTRYSAMHEWHAQRGARFVNAGLWKRPHSYPRSGETEDAAVDREALNVRRNVGLVDVSTLGKIELQGRDVVELLNRVYCNKWDTLQIGRCRYGLMLREDGMVMDDGTTSRLGPTHYLMTTTTVNAVKVMQHLERLLQVDWPELDVFVTSVTEQWSAAALSGPNAREVLARVVDVDVGDASLPFLGVTTCNVHTAAGALPARVFRMSYSGELAYEVHVRSDLGLAMWQAIMSAGEGYGIMAYGTEAMSTLRIEKGHVVVGAEADGRTTADDLGMSKLVNAGKWCIGKPLVDRFALNAPDRWQLVGLTALDGAKIPRGAKIVADPDAAAPNPMQGHVTSWCFSPILKAWIALALLAGGREREDEIVWAVSPLVSDRVQVRVGPPCFIDPEGERLRG